MSAAEALKAARAAGIRFEIDGDDLVLEAPVAAATDRARSPVAPEDTRHRDATPASADDRGRLLSSTLR